MAKSNSTGRVKRQPPNRLCDARSLQTIENCRQVIEFCRQASVPGGSEMIEMGRVRVLELVNEALEHVQGEMAVRQREVAHG